MATKDTKRVETATATEKSANFDSDMASSLIRKTTGFEILGTSISGSRPPDKAGLGGGAVMQTLRKAGEPSLKKNVFGPSYLSLDSPLTRDIRNPLRGPH